MVCFIARKEHFTLGKDQVLKKKSLTETAD